MKNICIPVILSPGARPKISAAAQPAVSLLDASRQIKYKIMKTTRISICWVYLQQIVDAPYTRVLLSSYR
jgi:hypothetical protein